MYQGHRLVGTLHRTQICRMKLTTSQMERYQAMEEMAVAWCLPKYVIWTIVKGVLLDWPEWMIGVPSSGKFIGCLRANRLFFNCLYWQGCNDAQSPRIPIIRQTNDTEWFWTSRSNTSFHHLLIRSIMNDKGNLNCGRRLLQSLEPEGWAAQPFNT